LHSVTEADGGAVLVLVKVAPYVLVVVVVVKLYLTFVLVGVGRVVVRVRIPDRTVGGGIVEVVWVVCSTVSVVVMAGAVSVTVVETGVSKVAVVVGTSGARRLSPFLASSRFCFAASMRARTHSTSATRSALGAQRRIWGMVVGVSKAAG
jgi:hypothetical protein